MPLVNAKELVKKAHEGRYAIAHININNLEWTKTILLTAQETNSPVILGTSEGAIKYMGGIHAVVGMVKGLLEDLKITVPVVLHLDHGSYEAALACIQAGYTSVMFDGSHLPWDENYAKTREVVAFAKKYDVSVEAEIGSIGGNEDGVIGTGELGDPKQAKLMKDLNIDMLAAGVGNIHGPYPRGWKGLSFKTMAELSKNVKIPYVLHGGSGIPVDQVKMVISMGVAKVNVNTELQIAFAKGVRTYIEEKKDLEGTGFDPRKLLSLGIANMRNTIIDKLEDCGSLGRADEFK